MSDPFVAEIRVVGFNFAPTGWAECNGQLMPISQNTALFSLLGTTYGGDGKSTFALPDIQGRGVVHFGQGPGLSNYTQGEEEGTQTVTLVQTQMPSHNHQVQAAVDPGEQLSPASDEALARSSPGNAWASSAAQNPVVGMSPLAIAVAGGDQPHNNMPPVLTLKYVIALQGVFPSRS
jgi:microcystin-dependent protein